MVKSAPKMFEEVATVEDTIAVRIVLAEAFSRISKLCNVKNANLDQQELNRLALLREDEARQQLSADVPWQLYLRRVASASSLLMAGRYFRDAVYFLATSSNYSGDKAMALSKDWEDSARRMLERIGVELPVLTKVAAVCPSLDPIILGSTKATVKSKVEVDPTQLYWNKDLRED